MSLEINNNQRYFINNRQTVSQPTSKAVQKKTDQKQLIRNTAIAVGGVSLLVLAIFKGKSIVRDIKNLLKKESKPQIKPEPAKPSIIPKPHFTCGEENPAQFAKEKSAYISSIRKEYIDIDPEVEKDKALQGLEALIKYGSRDDMQKLSLEYKVSKDDDVMQRYARLVRKVGLPEDSISISAKLNPKRTYYNDTTKKELMKTAKKLMVDDAPAGFFNHASYDMFLQYKHYSNDKDPEMASLSKSILDRIIQANPEMKDW